MIKFEGVECPIPRNAVVEVKTNSGISRQYADQVNWKADVYGFRVVGKSDWFSWSESSNPVHPDVYVELRYSDSESNIYSAMKSADVSWACLASAGDVKFRVVPDPMPEEVSEEKKPDPLFNYIAMVEKDLEFANKQETYWLEKLEKAKSKLAYWSNEQAAIHRVHGRLISGGMNGVEIQDE